MKNSDSENDSECFESAEESLDEDENRICSKVSKKTKSLCESEEKVDEPVVSQKDTLHSDLPVAEEEASNNLMKYRKRPERVKRMSSRSPTSGTSITRISPSIDSIFKTDIIAPDVLFQDITSNLSKNINKSLNTIQQTSSNVKDLILNSLPVSSLSEKETFSYDDNVERTSSVPISSNENSCKTEKKEGTISSDPEIPSKTIENLSYGNGKQDNVNEKIITSMEEKDQVVKTNKGSAESDKKNEVHIPEINVKKLENISKELKKGRNSKHEKKETNKEKISSNKVDYKTKKNIEPYDKNEPNSTLEVENFDDLKAIKEDNSENSFKNENLETEISLNKQQTSVTCETKEDYFNLLSSNISENVKTPENIKNQDIIETSNSKISLQKNSFQPTLDSNLSEDWDNSIHGSHTTEDNESLVKEDWDDFNVTSEKVTNNLDWNLEELKTVLKEMVPAEKNQVKEKENIKKEVESSRLEEHKEVNEMDSEGWDDFDISDHEIEYFNTEKTQDGNLQTDEIGLKDNYTENSSNKNKFEDLRQKEFKSDNISTEKVSAEKDEKLNEKKDVQSLVVTGKPIFKNLEQEKKAKTPATQKKEKEVSVQEIKPESDDNWGWDSWDEVPQEKEEMVEDISEPNRSEKGDGKEDNFCDESGWSGWDSFGQKAEDNQGNWNIGSWGVNLLINKATAVTQGISNVLEAGLNAPDPMTLARMEKLEREKIKDEIINEPSEEPPSDGSKKNSLTDVNMFPVFGITSLVAGVTSKIVEHSKIQEIGSKVITGGLDTLETFGKKTMEVLQEGDPGLRNKRAILLGTNKPILSQVLKEAREKADRENKMVKEKEMARKCHFETLFDDFQGLVHLEALEMLSTQCELKLEQIRKSMNSEEQEDLDSILEEVQQLCSLEDYGTNFSTIVDFKISLPMAIESLKDEISVRQIIQIHEDAEKWLQVSSENKTSVTLIHQKIVSVLAELTAATVHQFHKAGELLSVKECRKTVEEADALSRMTSILCMEINKICERFVALSLDKSNPNFNSEDARSLSEQVDIVMKNSTSYIRQAFNLLVPVVQIGAAV